MQQRQHPRRVGQPVLEVDVLDDGLPVQAEPLQVEVEPQQLDQPVRQWVLEPLHGPPFRPSRVQ